MIIMKVKNTTLKNFIISSLSSCITSVFALYILVIYLGITISGIANAFSDNINTTDVFLVQNIEASADLGTLDDSKSDVLRQVTYKAFNVLVQRIVPTSMFTKAKNISQEDIEALVKKREAVSERMTSHSYTGLYGVLFDSIALEAMLNKYGIRYANHYAPSTLIIPILHLGNEYIIWRNESWAQAWGKIPNTLGLTYTEVVTGTLEDIEAIKAETVMNSPYDNFSMILGNHECSRVAIVFAEQAKLNKLEVTIRLLEKNKETIKRISYQRTREENDQSFYTKISMDLVSKIDNLWKGEDLFDQDTFYTSRVYILANDPKTWNNILKLIENMSEIRNYRVIQNNAGVIELEINYGVTPAALSNLMLQKGLKVENQEGKVILSLTSSN